MIPSINLPIIVCRYLRQSNWLLQCLKTSIIYQNKLEAAQLTTGTFRINVYHAASPKRQEVLVLCCFVRLGMCRWCSHNIKRVWWKIQGPVVMVIDLVGQKQCIQKCQERPSVCKGVNYSRQSLLCELVSATEKTELRQGYVRVELNQVSNISAHSEPSMCICDSMLVNVHLYTSILK